MFGDRKVTNLFNGIWRSPIAELERGGSFPTHVAKCLSVLFDMLRETEDYSIFMEAVPALKKEVDGDKKYLFEKDRQAFYVEATTSLMQILNNKAERFQRQGKEADAERLRFGIDLYQFKGKKGLSKSNVEQIKNITKKLYCTLYDKNDTTFEEMVRFFGKASAVDKTGGLKDLESPESVAKVLTQCSLEQPKSLTPSSKPQETAMVKQVPNVSEVLKTVTTVPSRPVDIHPITTLATITNVTTTTEPSRKVEPLTKSTEKPIELSTVANEIMTKPSNPIATKPVVSQSLPTKLTQSSSLSITKSFNTVAKTVSQVTPQSMATVHPVKAVSHNPLLNKSVTNPLLHKPNLQSSGSASKPKPKRPVLDMSKYQKNAIPSTSKTVSTPPPAKDAAAQLREFNESVSKMLFAQSIGALSPHTPKHSPSVTKTYSKNASGPSLLKAKTQALAGKAAKVTKPYQVPSTATSFGPRKSNIKPTNTLAPKQFKSQVQKTVVFNQPKPLPKKDDDECEVICID